MKKTVLLLLFACATPHTAQTFLPRKVQIAVATCALLSLAPTTYASYIATREDDGGYTDLTAGPHSWLFMIMMTVPTLSLSTATLAKKKLSHPAWIAVACVSALSSILIGIKSHNISEKITDETKYPELGYSVIALNLCVLLQAINTVVEIVQGPKLLQ